MIFLSKWINDWKPSLKINESNGEFTFRLYNNSLNKIPVKNVIDIGCCIGDTIAMFEKSFCPENIYGFDPDENNCKESKKRCPRANIINSAVSNYDGENKLFISHANCGHSFYSNNKDQPSKIVNTIRMDTWARLNNISNFDFVKIDTEGNDLKVLDGFGDYINLIKILRVELAFNDTVFPGASLFYEIIKYLEDRSLKFYNFVTLSHRDNARLYWGDALFLRSDILL